MKRVLITGVAGFIGSNLLDYLLEKTDWQIDGIDNFSTGRKTNVEHNLSNSRFHLTEGSVFDLTSLKAYTTVFHLAALPRIQPSFELVTDHIKENLLASIHLVELMMSENHYPRLVNSSSSAIYGTPELIPTPETEKVDCLSPYAFQKYECEKYFDLISTRVPLDFVQLRYFNPFGPRSFNPENKFNAYSSVVGIFLNRKENDQPLLITGDGLQKRDFIHVYDLAKANLMAAEHPEKLNTAFNIGAAGTISVLELAKMISDDYEFIPKREGEAEITYAEVSKAREVLGWEPEYDLASYIKTALV
jgi:UDP-glucose 4-epimerase